MTGDPLIEGGHVLGPGRGLDGQPDIAVRAGVPCSPYPGTRPWGWLPARA